VPSLPSNVIVSPYGDGDGEIDVATVLSYLQVLAEAEGQALVYDTSVGSIPRSYSAGYESPVLDCPHTRLKELFAQVSVSTL
jgi:hypothetical protein